MTAFPGGIASFLGFTATHTLSQDAHAAQHNLEQAEIVATQQKVGTGASTPVANRVLRGTGTGTSSWAQVDQTTDITGATPVANGGTGQNNLTGLTLPAAILPASPFLITPVIANFTNAQHDHTNVAGGGQLGPASRTGGFFIGNIPAASFSTIGNRSVTGLGFTPKLVRFTILATSTTGAILMGNGAMTPLAQYYVANSADAAANRARNSSTSACIGWLTPGSVTPIMLASYVSMDTDGFTINVGTADGTFAVEYEAYA